MAEAGSSSGNVIETFLSGLNAKTSRGIPVGSGASSILAEVVMADIDQRILNFTDSFVRYVDDVYIFFDSEERANLVLYELTKYLHSTHRLVFSSGKTKVIPTPTFLETFLHDEETIEKKVLHEKLAELRTQEYMTEEDLLEFDDLDTPEQFHLRAEAYKERFVEALQFQPLNLGVMRHIFRQATAYRVRSILPLVLDNFTYLLPVVRDVVNYINKVTTSKIAKRFSSQFQQTIDNPYAVLPYVNVWIYTLFQNQAFNATDIVMDYSKIIRIREQALVACRQRNAQWFKEKKDEIDTFGAWTVELYFTRHTFFLWMSYATGIRLSQQKTTWSTRQYAQK